MQITSSLAAIGPWVVMTTHQPPYSGSCLGEGGLVMPLQVLAPGMPHVLSEGLHAQDLFRLKLVRALLLRKSLHNEPFDTVKVVGFGELLQEPDNRIFITQKRHPDALTPRKSALKGQYGTIGGLGCLTDRLPDNHAKCYTVV